MVYELFLKKLSCNCDTTTSGSEEKEEVWLANNSRSTQQQQRKRRTEIESKARASTSDIITRSERTRKVREIRTTNKNKNKKSDLIESMNENSLLADYVDITTKMDNKENEQEQLTGPSAADTSGNVVLNRHQNAMKDSKTGAFSIEEELSMSNDHSPAMVAPSFSSPPTDDITTLTITIPRGLRWAISNSSVDLSGSWVLAVSPEWKDEYDLYLQSLGINMFVRKIALSVIHRTKEETIQIENGLELKIISVNPKGKWERTLISSGSSLENDEYEPLVHQIKNANGDDCEAESWWEDQGKVHHSWMRGGPSGDYQSIRYLENNGNFYICESYFYKRKSDLVSSKPTGKVVWRFERA